MLNDLKKKRNLSGLTCQTSTNARYCQVTMPDISVPVKENIAIHCPKSRAKRENKSAKYVLFVRPNPWNGNLTQVGSRSFLGSWELLGIFKSLFVFTLENQALASRPLNPPLRTQRQRRGMLNVNGQTAPAPSERERWRYKA